MGIKERMSDTVNEFVKKIIIDVPDKSSGYRRQKVQIVWNSIGKLKQDEKRQTVEQKGEAERHSLSDAVLR